MSLVPLLIELIVRIWFKFSHFDTLYDAPDSARLGADAKLSAMLLMAHTLAAGGNVLKMWLMGWNPLAFNHAELLALVRTFFAFWKAGAKRDAAIEERLVEGWGRLLGGARRG